jgi:hypothetical protein
MRVDVAQVKERLLAWNPPPPLYHVTHEARLPRIATEGLIPGQRRSLSIRPPVEHLAGAIFLTGAGGLLFWYHIAEDWAHHEADDIVSEGWVPVVLRVRARKCKPDALGSRDAGHPAFRCTESVPPQDIEIWDGTQWLPISEYEQVDPSAAVDDEGFMLTHRQNVLLPKLPAVNPTYLRKLDQFPRLIVGQLGGEAVYRYGDWEIITERVGTNYWKVTIREDVGPHGKTDMYSSTTHDGAVCAGKIAVDLHEAYFALDPDEASNLHRIWMELYHLIKNEMSKTRRLRTRPPDRASIAREMELRRRAAQKGELSGELQHAYRWWESLPLDARVGLIEDRLKILYCIHGTDPRFWT